MGILSHVGHEHLGDLMDLAAIIAVVEGGRGNEHRVEPLAESLTASQQPDEPLGVVEHTPGPMPGTALGERVAPLVGPEGDLERAVEVTPAGKARSRVDDIAVIERAP